MNTYLRIFWLISLLFFTAGCSGYHSACFNRSGEVDDLPWGTCALRQGDKVRITTVAGNRVDGNIERVTQEWITLVPENQGDPPRLYAVSQIVSIRKSQSRSKSSKTVKNPRVGDYVRLNLTDGSRVEGKVQVVNSEEIVLAHQGESVQPLGYPTSRIQSIEMESTSGGSSVLVPIMVLVGMGLIIGGVILADEMSDLGEWGGS